MAGIGFSGREFGMSEQERRTRQGGLRERQPITWSSASSQKAAAAVLGRARGSLRHLGRLRRLEFRSCGRWMGWDAYCDDIDGDYVHGDGLRAGGALLTIPTAGAAMFARRAMGPWGGFMTGTAIRSSTLSPCGDRHLYRGVRRGAHRHRRVGRLPGLLPDLRRHPPLWRR